ncbi:hypothetical protein Q5P01_009404 [Channa striata]|uniref:Uncharacterized protein n=1 Tax=Channa striata TaxID=64152 RepID=A0AA88N3Z8_CHASR|nr:hypothetical protein Q5P01_009404 [Channa striata]
MKKREEESDEGDGNIEQEAGMRKEERRGGGRLLCEATQETLQRILGETERGDRADTRWQDDKGNGQREEESERASGGSGHR